MPRSPRGAILRGRAGASRGARSTPAYRCLPGKVAFRPLAPCAVYWQHPPSAEVGPRPSWEVAVARAGAQSLCLSGRAASPVPSVPWPSLLAEETQLTVPVHVARSHRLTFPCRVTPWHVSNSVRGGRDKHPIWGSWKSEKRLFLDCSSAGLTRMSCLIGNGQHFMESGATD